MTSPENDNEREGEIDTNAKSGGPSAHRSCVQSLLDRGPNCPDGSFGYVEVDGVVDNEVRYAYFQPTPFGEWHIKVTGDGLDLSGVTRVVMQFAGSVIPEV